MERLVSDRSPAWKWYVCGILLLATMLNYMDRQTLSVTITDISRELHLTNEQYGNLEFGFGLAFAVGGLATGLIVDFVSVRWLYPIVFAGWSMAGFAAAFAQPIGELLMPPGMDESVPPGYVGLLVCRIVLGFFEAGHWPCALVTSQRLLSAQDRPLGNSLLQSGAAIGAIVTPLVVQATVSDAPGSWRLPFQMIGVLGLLWIVPWLSMVRESDLRPPEFRQMPEPCSASAPWPTGERVAQPDGKRADDNPFRSPESSSSGPPWQRGAFTVWRRFAVLVLTVVVINLCFQFFRAWLPKFLREFHGFERSEVNYFTSAYFIATDVGCLSVGLAVKRLTMIGWPVHRARMATFALCACLTALSTLAAFLPRGPLLLGVLLVIGFGALGLFPNYYSFTQDLSTRHQGIVTGTLGFTTWTCTAMMQKFIGQRIDQTGSYAEGIFVVGLLPLIACAALLLFWNLGNRDKRANDN